jgi:hypothetical protein
VAALGEASGGEPRPGVDDGGASGGFGVGSAATPDEGSGGRSGPGVAGRDPAGDLRMATSADASHHDMATRGVSAEAQDQGDRRGTVGPHTRHDERPGK